MKFLPAASLTLLLLSAFTPGAARARGGRDFGDGGDLVSSVFFPAARDTITYLNRDTEGEKFLKEYNLDGKLLARTVRELTVTVSDAPLYDRKGVRRDAIGVPGHITLDRERWLGYINRHFNLNRLVFHEILRSTGLYDDGDDYRISGHLPAALDFQPGAASAGAGCARAEDSNEVICPLSEGELFVPTKAGDVAILRNETGSYLQIDQIQGMIAAAGLGSESQYCVYLNSLQAEQSKVGEGQVGCSHKHPGLPYMPIKWAGNTSPYSTSLMVKPGDKIYIVSNTAMSPQPHDYVVSVSEFKDGGMSYRFPATDLPQVCNGAVQYTPWTPRENTTGQDLYIGGAAVNSVTPLGVKESSDKVDYACVRIFDHTQTVMRWEFCDPSLKKPGWVSFGQPQVVHAGEFISVQATYRCDAGFNWNWAAYVSVWR